MGNRQRVILIKGDQSKWYEQAIFIVRQSTPGNKMPVDFVLEAERIINGYMDTSGSVAVANSNTPKKSSVQRRRFDYTINFIMLISVMMLAVILVATKI